MTTIREDSTEQPRTFLDDPSDDETAESPTSPVIQRASSVRVGRPQVIQHSNSSAASVPKLYAPQNTPLSNESSLSSQPAQTVGVNLSAGPTPAVATSGKDAPGGPTDALKALEGEQKEELTALPQNPTGQEKLKETLVSWPDTPSRLEALDTMPTPMGGFGSMQIPRSSNDTFSTSTTTTYVSPSPLVNALDGLRSNPLTEMEKKLGRAISAPVRNSRRVMIRPTDLVISKAGHDHKLFRENIVSTPYPARESSDGQIDMVVTGPNDDAGSQKVTPDARKTPRLRRAKLLFPGRNSTGSDDISATRHSSLENAPEIPLSTKPATITPIVATTSRSDRFPSPSAPEILFLNLALARHPGVSCVVEVEVTDKATFDDEKLFTVIREKYINQLMGRARWWLCARRVEAAGLNGEATSSSSNRRFSGFWHGHHISVGTNDPFDSADFVAHLLTPRLGRRRKVWLLWLRSNQYSESLGSASSSRQGRRSRLPQPVYSHGDNLQEQDEEKASSSPVFSFIHSRQSSGGNPVDMGIDGIRKGPVPGASIGGEKATLSHQPSTSLPRMPFSSPPGQPPQTPLQLTSFHRSKSLAMAASYPSTPTYPLTSNNTSTQGPHTIHLTHTFSLRLILLAALLIIIFSLLTTILWILLGYPGRSAAQGDTTTTVGGQVYTVEWQRDAQARVGVGLVIGAVVFLVGAIGEVAWVWGSWVLV